MSSSDPQMPPNLFLGLLNSGRLRWPHPLRMGQQVILRLQEKSQEFYTHIRLLNAQRAPGRLMQDAVPLTLHALLAFSLSCRLPYDVKA